MPRQRRRYAGRSRARLDHPGDGPAHGTRDCRVRIHLGSGRHLQAGSPSIRYVIDRDLELYRGFDGTEIAEDQRDKATNLTILSGVIDDNDTVNGNRVTETTADIVATNTARLVQINGNATAIFATTIIDGFTITGGQIAGNGAGLFCNGNGGRCSPTLSNLNFRGNCEDGVSLGGGH